MSTFALIFGGNVVELSPAEFEVNGALVWVDVTSVTPVPEVNWTAMNTGGAWTFAAPPAPPAPTLDQQATTAMGAGLTVTSTGTPALNGTYDVGSASQDHFSAEMIALLNSGGTTFADGTASVVWPDMAGVNHTFTAAEFRGLALAVGAYVAALFKVANGTLAAMPAATATIP